MAFDSGVATAKAAGTFRENFSRGRDEYTIFRWTSLEIGNEASNTESAIDGLPVLFRILFYGITLSAAAGGATKFNPRFLRTTGAAIGSHDDLNVLGTNAADIKAEPLLLVCLGYGPAALTRTMLIRDRTDAGTATGQHTMVIKAGA